MRTADREVSAESRTVVEQLQGLVVNSRRTQDAAERDGYVIGNGNAGGVVGRRNRTHRECGGHRAGFLEFLLLGIRTSRTHHDEQRYLHNQIRFAHTSSNSTKGIPGWVFVLGAG